MTSDVTETRVFCSAVVEVAVPRDGRQFDALIRLLFGSRTEM